MVNSLGGNGGINSSQGSSSEGGDGVLGYRRRRRRKKEKAPQKLFEESKENQTSQTLDFDTLFSVIFNVAWELLIKLIKKFFILLKDSLIKIFIWISSSLKNFYRKNPEIIKEYVDNSVVYVQDVRTKISNFYIVLSEKADEKGLVRLWNQTKEKYKHIKKQVIKFYNKAMVQVKAFYKKYLAKYLDKFVDPHYAEKHSFQPKNNNFDYNNDKNLFK